MGERKVEVMALLYQSSETNIHSMKGGSTTYALISSISRSRHPLFRHDPDVAVTGEAGTGWDELADDDVLLETQ